MSKNQVEILVTSGSSIAQLKNLNRKVARTTAGIASLGTTAKATSTSILGAFTTMLVAAAPLVVVIDSFAKFQDGLRKINTVAGLSERQLDMLGDSTLLVASKFAKSATDVQDAMFNIAQTQRFGAEASEVLNASGVLAVGGMTSLADAVSLTTTVLDSYGTKVGSASDVTNKLFAIQTFGKLTISDLNKNLGKVAATASLVGISFDELGIAIATMTRMGQRPSITMTGLNTLMVKLIKSTGKLNNIFVDDFGNSANALKKLGLAGVINKIQEATGGAADKIQALGFSVRTFRAIATLASTQGLQLSKTIASQFSKAQGLDTKAMEQMMKSPMFLLRQLGTGIKEVAITLGTVLGGQIKSVSNFIKDMLPKLVSWIKNNKVLISTLLKFTTILLAVKTTTLLTRAAFGLLGGSLKDVGTGIVFVYTKLRFLDHTLTRSVFRIMRLQRGMSKLYTTYKLWQTLVVARGGGGFMGGLHRFINSMGAGGIARSFNAGALGKVMATVKAIGAGALIAGTAFLGWKLGNFISEITGLKGILDEFWTKYLTDQAKVQKGIEAAKGSASISSLREQVKVGGLENIKSLREKTKAHIQKTIDEIKKQGLVTRKLGESQRDFDDKIFAESLKRNRAYVSNSETGAARRQLIAIDPTLEKTIILNKQLIQQRRNLQFINKNIAKKEAGIQTVKSDLYAVELSKMRNGFIEKRFTTLEKINNLTVQIMNKENRISSIGKDDTTNLLIHNRLLEELKLKRFKLLDPIRQAGALAQKEYEFNKLTEIGQLRASSNRLQFLNLARNAGAESLINAKERFKLMTNESNIHKLFLERKKQFEFDGLTKQGKILALTKEKLRLEQAILKAQSQVVKDSLGIRLLEVKTKLGDGDKGREPTRLLEAMRLGSSEAAEAINRSRNSTDNKIVDNTRKTVETLKSIDKKMNKTSSAVSGTTQTVNFVTM